MEKCKHPSNKLTKIESSEGCVFCQNCGLILYPAKSNKYINTIKPMENQSKTETDPIDLFLNSYKETPFVPLQKDSIYPEKRSRAIKILEKFNNLYHFSDEIFFLALTYMDYIFKSIYSNKNKNVTRKNEELYILNCLLISEKFYDKDINDIPDYAIYMKNTIYDIDVIDIKENEIDCLKILKYKLDHHSIYDILKGYMYNGFIFEKEIESNSIGYQIKFAYNYAEKIYRDIAYSYIAILYPPYLIAFVIIQLTRKKFFDSKYMKKIKKIYGIKQNDYKECYEDVKAFLNNVEKGLKVSDYNKINKEKENKELKHNETINKEKENKELKNNELINKEKDFSEKIEEVKKEEIKKEETTDKNRENEKNEEIKKEDKYDRVEKNTPIISQINFMINNISNNEKENSTINDKNEPSTRNDEIENN